MHIIKYLFFDKKVLVIIDIYLHSLALQSIFYTIAKHDAFTLLYDYVKLETILHFHFYNIIFVKLSIAMITSQHVAQITTT